MNALTLYLDAAILGIIGMVLILQKDDVPCLAGISFIVGGLVLLSIAMSITLNK